ncbi:DNA-directed RNA polymerase subunit beta [Pigmentibacter sp. JX0631]|uniref:DNA-directed RNA polymerase subunit beta n=1 Tax=Pigmentibacter sp. JX0631 TaxID=2976982 RepID=UPI002469BF4C|nr:DNA-directed RNA polymerase subunit beta [Pigmentibacter sp. JX0631]WGL60732.1 DNA-directed RNA polymerase subunit beta [Pigmentibacter sp. JX0631]
MANLASSFVRHRRSFAKVKPIIGMPNLIDIQKKSYAEFLQGTDSADSRIEAGLQGVFKSVFPVQDFDATASVEFVSYSLDEPKYTVEECRSKGMTYAAPVKVLIRLIIWDVDHETGVKSIRGFKEQEVYFGEIPLMTQNGTFIINGTERVVVSQLHRSPGVFFDHDKGKTLSSGKFLYNARIIPYRGSWLDFEFDTKDILYCRIDRRRKMPATVLLKALGYTTEELLGTFYECETIINRDGQFYRKVDLDRLRGQRASSDIMDPKNPNNTLVKRNRKITALHIKQLKAAGVEELHFPQEELVGKIIGQDIIDEDTGEVLFPINTDISEKILDAIMLKGISKFQILFIDDLNVDSSFRDTLMVDKTVNTEEALLEIYRRMRPGDPPTLENASNLFQNLFFEKDRYDLSRVGRLKLNEKLDLNNIDIDYRTLTREDIIGTVKRLLDVRSGKIKVDDIDHLGNRRVRAVGELLENQYRIGLTRIERAIKERLQLQDLDSLMPHDLVNAKPVTAVVKEFFGSSQLSQFMDQTNPLAEVYHKRRLSALGPGGLSRERAGFEVRDVHPTHYGRICPIETPEGPNIGLIVSLASFAQVNKYGFIETPYRTVVDRSPTDEVRYYSSTDEWRDHVIAQARIKADAENKINSNELLNARSSGETNIYTAEEVDLMDVATNQAVSVAASLIPFLQNDDAHRALMGANMQRQGLPLLRTKAPLVGTGMERTVAADSGVTVVAKRAGTVISVDAERVVIKANEVSSDVTEVASEVDIYTLVKFTRSNVDTCVNQKPIVKVGDKVEKGDIIADGFATEMGELALGQNVVVAFLPWNGYNYEDGIVVSERVVREDLYTSVYIQEFECISRDTKLGKEEITSDIPNVSDESLKDLDDAGVVRIGAEVKPGDILVGKLTPKAETQLTPEEKLLRAIFGEKAADVRDTSLRVPPGVQGTVIGAKVFSREGAELDSRMIQVQEQEIAKLKKDERDRIQIIRKSTVEKLESLFVLEVAAVSFETKQDGHTFKVSSGEKIPKEAFAGMSIEQIKSLELVSSDKSAQLAKIKKSMNEKIALVREMTEAQIARAKRGDELPPGVIKMVKVYVAIKRRLQVGDKLAGRHGNKGVISKIVPVEDMPYLENGQPVDIVLSPLGVPSRMNIGQIMETHFGWAARGIGLKINDMLDKAAPRAELEDYICKVWDDPSVHEFVKSCSNEELRQFVRKYKEGVTLSNPVFDGAEEEEIFKYLELADLDRSGQVTLYDGRTGEKFNRQVTVGVMYVLRLHHLVDEKIHARSIGPYSLVTQQPLGGKAQFGGQRLGEMEVWAMEAYGAAYTLQEFLTVKSDDIAGRTKMYEAVVKGENMMLPGLPESFNVLVKEMQSLALDVSLIRDENEISLDDLQRDVREIQ